MKKFKSKGSINEVRNRTDDQTICKKAKKNSLREFF